MRSMHAARVGSWALVFLTGASTLMRSATADRLKVFNPGTITLDRGFTLKWESVGQELFDIELYGNSDCSGEMFADLCGKPDVGCGDSRGDYNVLIPEPNGAGERSILVRVRGSDVYGCTGPFLTSETKPEGAEDSYLKVYSPEDDVVVGLMFDALWDYDDGNGVTADRFTIDLYAPDCKGPVLATLCDKPDKGCKDSRGDYPVTIPDNILPGEYALKIGVFGAASPVGCSPKFNVESSTIGATISLEQVPTPHPDYQKAKEPCDSEKEIDVRYAETTERVYFEHTEGDTTGGCANLTQILKLRSEKDGTIKGPLYPLDPSTGEKLTLVSQVTGHWLIESDLYVTHGITLQLRGTAVGGDCDSLRILSTDTKHYNLRGHGGNLDIEDTTITSWDPALTPPGPRQTDLHSAEDDYEPRSYISCISEVITDDSQTCVGKALNTRGECRMDIVKSEIAYLGYYGAEAYGLTWKVRGFCKDKSNPKLFEEVNTYGNVMDSDIHHLFYGLYTYGHLGGLWTNNDMHDNEWYGFDPHDDSDYLTIHNNKVWGNGKHGIIASKRCNSVSIQNNEVSDGGLTAAGIFLHRSSDDAIVKGNWIHDMQDSGLAALESFNIVYANNLIERCKYGIRLSLGSAKNIVHSNTFSDLTSYGFFTYVGSNTPDVPGDIYRPYDNRFTDNIVIAPAVAKLKEGDRTVVTGNTFAQSVLLEIDNSADVLFSDNSYDSLKTTVTVKNGACFASGSDLEPLC